MFSTCLHLREISLHSKYVQDFSDSVWPHRESYKQFLRFFFFVSNVSRNIPKNFLKPKASMTSRNLLLWSMN